MNIKIINISANNNEYYAIGNDGNLYENKNNKVICIKPPENTKKFLQCTCGNGYVICLLENNNKKGIIYSKGIENMNFDFNVFYYNNNKNLIKYEID